jgi:nucleoside diphosphate kinase
MKICCIIKPSAVPHAEAIISALAEAGIEVIGRKDIVYTIPLIRALYDHMPDDAVCEIAQRMAHRPGIALLTRSPSIDRLLEIVGRESDPARCAAGSLRARFGNGAPEERVGSWPWWENALHRPVDEREAARDLALVFDT